MHKQTHKRAFYTLAGCIAALALCVAASLFLLTPAPKAQDVTIPGTRGDIYATVQLPGKLARGEELPLVVLCHGFTGSRSGDGHFAPLAADLAAQGIATVRLDFPGCGNSTEPFTAYTLSNMTDDVESAITYMQQTYGTGRTALVGHSMGGRLASLYPQRRGGITALALWSPANGAGLRGMEFLNIDDFPPWKRWPLRPRRAAASAPGASMSAERCSPKCAIPTRTPPCGRAPCRHF